MALHPCTECQQDVSDKAVACPHCGAPTRASTTSAGARRTRLFILAGAVLAALAIGGVAFTRLGSDYSRVEQLRAEQDAVGTHDQDVRQRFFRLYKAHPQNAMYIYLWARCVDDAAGQLALAEEGVRADPRFSWNYNVAARALARLGRVPEAYDEAVKGAAIDPGNMLLADKQRSLKVMVDHKLPEEARPAPNGYTSYESRENFEKGAVHYQGLFEPMTRAPDRSDLHALETSRLADYKGPIADAVRGLVVCANPFADTCVRAYVPRDARFKNVWPPSAIDVGALKEHQLVGVAGSVVTNDRGEPLMLVDAVTVEAP